MLQQSSPRTPPSTGLPHPSSNHAIADYAIRLRKLSVRLSVFRWWSNGSKFVTTQTTPSMSGGVSLITACTAYASTDNSQIVRIETKLLPPPPPPPPPHPLLLYTWRTRPMFTRVHRHHAARFHNLSTQTYRLFSRGLWQRETYNGDFG